MTPRLQRDIELVGLARAFFDIRNLRTNCQALRLPVSVSPSGAPKPLSVMDFIEHLGLKGERHNPLHVARVVRRMGEAGMLLDVGQYHPNMTAGLGRMYLSVGVAGSELSSMAAVLGGEYLTSVPQSQAQASASCGRARSGGEWVVKRSSRGRRSKMLSCSTCSIWLRLQRSRRTNLR